MVTICTVYPFCRIRRFGRNFRIRHGRTYVDPCRCTFCKCFFGRLHCSRRRRVCLRNCTIERNCTLPTGTQLQHGQSAQVDCNRYIKHLDSDANCSLAMPQTNRCFCRFGRLYCTDRDCDNERNNTCARCIFQPKRTVCGRNGRTYPNRCFAVNCAGISPVDILDGPCSRIVSH